MKDYQGEQILVVTRQLFDNLSDFQGINTDVERYLPSLLNPENNFFMDRGEAEDDPSHKQLIPYCIFRVKDEQGDRYLHYTRGKSGGESRLHAQVSIGIGGHINPVDQREDHLGMGTYMAGVEREIDEELNITGAHTNKIVALLNDDSNEVGKVHLGVVHMSIWKQMVSTQTRMPLPTSLYARSTTYAVPSTTGSRLGHAAAWMS